MANKYFTFIATSSILSGHHLSRYIQTLYVLSNLAFRTPRMRCDFILANLAEKQPPSHELFRSQFQMAAKHPRFPRRGLRTDVREPIVSGVGLRPSEMLKNEE